MIHNIVFLKNLDSFFLIAKKSDIFDWEMLTPEFFILILILILQSMLDIGFSTVFILTKGPVMVSNLMTEDVYPKSLMYSRLIVFLIVGSNNLTVGSHKFDQFIPSFINQRFIILKLILDSIDDLIFQRVGR